jgi:hypothetical protein
MIEFCAKLPAIPTAIVALSSYATLPAVFVHQLRSSSFPRPAKLFTADKSLFVAEVGQLNDQTVKRLLAAVTQVFSRAT